MTDYAIEITELWTPLQSFNTVMAARELTPEAARDILTHTNNPRVMDVLAEKVEQALAGGGNYGLWRSAVLGIVAGRDGRDATREKMWKLAEANGDGEAFAKAAGQKKFIGLGGMRKDIYDARLLGKLVELNNQELAEYTDILFAEDVERISMQRSSGIPAAALDFSLYSKLEVLALGLSQLPENAELKLPRGIRWLDIRGNAELLGDLSQLERLTVLQAGFFDQLDFVLPPRLRELSLPGERYPLAVLAQLKDCHNLKKLLLSCNKTAKGERAVYFELPEGIEDLELSSVKGLHGDMFKLDKYKQLKRVNLAFVNLEFWELRLPEDIEELNLSYAGGLARDVLDLSMYRQLKKLELRTNSPSFKKVLVPAGCVVDRGEVSEFNKKDIKVKKVGGGNIFGKFWGRG